MPPKIKLFPKVTPTTCGVRFGRNPSFRSSLALSASVFKWLPTSFVLNMTFPIRAFFSATCLLVVSFATFVGLNLAMIFAGTLGFLSPPLEDAATPEANSQK